MALSRMPYQKGPPARDGHAAVAFNHHMLVWGGDGDFREESDASAVEIFDVLSTAWLEPRRLSGKSLPETLYRMAVAWDDKKAYMFGGLSGFTTCTRDVYEVDLTSLKYKKLVQANTSSESIPSASYGSAMVLSGRRLVTYGGRTDDGQTNDLHVFDLDTKLWSAQETTGDKPPQLHGHTFNMIDQRRALLFGGWDGSSSHNDTYLLDIEAWTWSIVEVCETKPPARTNHSACFLSTEVTGHHPVLVVVGGRGVGSDALSDVWLLDVTAKSWTEVILPIIGRCRHSTVVFGTGNFRVLVLFGGSATVYGGNEMEENTLLLFSYLRGSWVILKVVTGVQLYNGDLKEELKQLQISFPPCNNDTDSEFSDLCLLGKPEEICVWPEESVTISPPGLGATLTVPAGAIQSTPDTPANVTLKTCVPTPSFTFPEGYTPLSAVYHLSTDSSFKKKVELTFEHFAEVETEEQAKEVVLFRASSAPRVTDGKREFVFRPVEGGSFAVGEGHCTVSTQEIGFLGAGALQSSQIRKRYAVLCSYSNEVKDVGHAAIAITVDSEAYMANFRNAVQQEWGTSLSHRCRLNASFNDSVACVNYPQSLNGWNIVSDSSECILSQEDVDISKPSALSLHSYPPRVFFEMIPTETAEPCTLQFSLSGLSKDVNFQVSLRDIQAIKTESGNTTTYEKEAMVTEKPTLITLEYLFTRDRGEIRVIEESANHYNRVGPILLNDRYGERVDTIESDERGKGEKIMLQIYKLWMREDVNYSWTSLAECFRECNLNRLAHAIELHFGLPSPPVRKDSQLIEENIRPRKRPTLPNNGLIIYLEQKQLLVLIGLPVCAVLLYMLYRIGSRATKSK